MTRCSVTPVNVVAYCRVSTDRQAEEGLGLDVQRQQIERWASSATEPGRHQIVAWHSDEGLSGSLAVDDRPGLAAALATIADGGAEGLVVAKLDRLARNLTVQEVVLGMVWAGGGRVFTADMGEVPQDDRDDPMRTAMRQMVGVFAQLERAMIAARMRAGRRLKHERGGYAGFGSPRFGSRAEDKELVPDTGEQQAIARMVELRGQGLSLRAIAARLDTEGLPPKRGGTWHSDVVRRVLRRVAAPTP